MAKKEWARDLIKELKPIEGIVEVMIITDKGEKLWKDPETSQDEKYLDLWNLVANIRDLVEIDLLFDNVRIFVKKIRDKFLVVFATHSASMAYLRLKCENFIRQQPF